MRLIFDQPGRRGIRRETTGRVVLGAATTASQLLESDLLRGLLPKLPQYLKLVSSTPIRNMGTVAGNFINGSPIGDLTIMFLALGASVTLLDAADSTRELALPDLYLRYKKLAKAADEQVIDISFPAPLASDFFHFEKVDLFLNKKSDIFQAIFGARNGRCSKNPRIRAHTRHEAVCESRM